MRPVGGGRDHLRSRGVYKTSRSPRRPTPGSSPLARGLHLPDGGGVQPGGIIPARAGFTLGRSSVGWRGRDHPRSRGVYSRRMAFWAPTPGSSPLARGLRERPRPPRTSGGIIPARAGFTGRDRPRGRMGEDHPRSRGVYTPPTRRRLTTPGSSPLARGLRHRSWASCTSQGIIPARAGFTNQLGRRGRGRPDHPRSRGVYSSHRAGRPANLWIIPARAGFTGTSHRQSEPPKDHPRSRGVYSFHAGQAAGAAGSSPLARGLLRPGRGVPPRRRIIPARAGFTTRLAAAWRASTDHPRSRGVYAAAAWEQTKAAGSSPLARGLHYETMNDAERARIIPARAGFTSTRGRLLGRRADHPRSRGVYLKAVVIR